MCRWTLAREFPPWQRELTHRDSMMITNGAVGWQRACGPAVLVLPEGALRRPSALHRIARGQGKGFLLAGWLIVLTACVAVGFVAYIVLEAFDLDPDLWPFETQESNLAFQAQPLTGGPSVGVLASLDAIQCFVITAGAHLVRRHRARSDLVIAHPCVSIAFNMAEPRWLHLLDIPALGHSFSRIRPMTGIHADERGQQMSVLSRACCLS
jgi:hypothetical protein